MAAICLDMRRARENDLRSRNASSHPSGSGHHPSDYAEEEKQRRRHEWMLEQEKKREHERRKQIMIQQYEARRAHELALRNAHRSSHRARTRSQSRSRSFSSSRSRERKRTPSRSRSRNKSTRNRDRSRSRSSRSRSSDHSRKQRVRCNVSKTLVMAKSAPVFKGPEISPIPLADLKKIKIDIHRQIPTTVPQPEKLERDILNPEDIVVARKDGEGIIPIFDRPELKTTGISTPEVKELRTIISVQNGKRRSSRRRSSSSSSSRHRRSPSSNRRSSSSSPRHRRSRSPRRESRYKSSRYEKESRHNSKYREHSRDRKNDDKPRSRDRHRLSEAGSRDNRRHGSSSRGHGSRHRSTSRDRDRRHSSHRIAHNYDRYESHSSRRVPPYMKPLQFPYYFADYMRPIVIDPAMAMRAPMPYVRGRMPLMMGMGGPIRPNFPRFGPPEMIRPYGPPGPPHSRPGRL